MSAELLCIAILNIGMPNAEFACEQMEHVVNAADDLNFEPEILVAMIHYESRWNPAAVSRSQGSRGWRYARKIQRLARRIKAQVRQVEEDGC